MTTSANKLTGFRCDRTAVHTESGKHTHDRLTFQFGEPPTQRIITYALRPTDGLHLIHGPRPQAEQPGIHAWLCAHSLAVSDPGRRLLAETAVLGQQRLLGYQFFHQWDPVEVYEITRRVFKTCALQVYRSLQAAYPSGDALAAFTVLDAALSRPPADDVNLQLVGCSVLLAPPLPPQPPTDVAVAGHGDSPATVALLQRILATLQGIASNVARVTAARDANRDHG
jgi:hypothetical protein